MRIDGRGTYEINATLVIGSNTTLEVSDAVEIKLKGEAVNCYNMVQSAALSRPDVNVTVTRPPNKALSNGVSTINSPIVTVASTLDLSAGMEFFGRGIPYDTFIQSVTNGTTVVLTKNATATLNASTDPPNGPSWGAGGAMSAIVTWTDHGLSTGQCVYLSNVTPSQYIGVFRILHVFDSNTIIIGLVRLPTTTPSAVSGSIKARLADERIALKGGRWNHNRAALIEPGGVGPKWYQHSILLVGVAGLRVEGLHFTGINEAAGRFSVNLGAVRDFSVGHLHADAAGDILKIYGPAFGGEVFGGTGRSNDDVMSLHTREGPRYDHYRVTYGDVLGVSVRDISGHTAVGRLCSLYGSADEFMDSISIDGLTGTSGAGATALTFGGEITIAKFGKVTISGVHVGTTASTISVMLASVDSLTVADSSVNPRNSYSNPHFYSIGSTSSVRVLTFEKVNFATTASASTAAIFANTDSLVLKSCNIAGLGTNARPIAIEGSVKMDTYDGCNIELNGSGFINYQTSSGSKTLVTGSRIKGGFSGWCFNVATNISADFTFIGNTITDCSVGLVRAGGSSSVVNVSGSGNTIAAGSFYTVDALVNSGSPDFTALTPTIRLTIPESVQTVAFPTPGTPVSLDELVPAFNRGLNITVGALADALLIQNPNTLPPVGTAVQFMLTQDGTGGRAVTWGTNYIFPTAWSDAGNTANKQSMVRFVSNGSKLVAQGANSWF